MPRQETLWNSISLSLNSAPEFSLSHPLEAGIRAGRRREIARAITLVESNRADHRRSAEQLLQSLRGCDRQAIRLGISGVPGVGKSTFIEALGSRLIERDYTVAVLSIDPSSAISGGSILGDKTRMERLSRSKGAYIRPSPSAGSLGGVARRTRESILILEAAGFDVVIVETVGVGQSETVVSGMTDLFLLLLLPGGGDELQGIKRGIMELADIVAINKADDDLEAAAGRSVAEYKQALGLIQRRIKDWPVPVMSCSARDDSGIGEIWAEIEKFMSLIKSRGILDQRRAAQSVTWFREELNNQLLDIIQQSSNLSRQLEQLENRVRNGVLTAPAAARDLIDNLMNRSEN